MYAQFYFFSFLQVLQMVIKYIFRTRFSILKKVISVLFLKFVRSFNPVSRNLYAVFYHFLDQKREICTENVSVILIVSRNLYAVFFKNIFCNTRHTKRTERVKKAKSK
jgi:hypothetical protein